VTIRRCVVWIGAAGLFVVCEPWLDSCLGSGRCLSSVPRSGGWWALATAAGTFLLTLTALAWTMLVTWLAVRARLDLQKFPHCPCPIELEERVQRAGIRRIRFLGLAAPVAFCAGGISPTVYVSRGLLDLLNADELQAVLLHEAEHARVREPLRRAARTALAEVCFYVPLLAWWAARKVEESELQADRAAIAAMGAPVVARALWATGDGRSLSAVAGFSGAIRLRVAQLLGDEVHLTKPDSRLFLVSIVGSSFALTIMWCLAQIILGGRGFVLPGL
jgi:Peptidase family M48